MVDTWRRRGWDEMVCLFGHANMRGGVLHNHGDRVGGCHVELGWECVNEQKGPKGKIG